MQLNLSEKKIRLRTCLPVGIWVGVEKPAIRTTGSGNWYLYRDYKMAQGIIVWAKNMGWRCLAN